MVIDNHNNYNTLEGRIESLLCSVLINFLILSFQYNRSSKEDLSKLLQDYNIREDEIEEAEAERPNLFDMVNTFPPPFPSFHHIIPLFLFLTSLFSYSKQNQENNREDDTSTLSSEEEYEKLAAELDNSFSHSLSQENTLSTTNNNNNNNNNNNTTKPTEVTWPDLIKKLSDIASHLTYDIVASDQVWDEFNFELVCIRSAVISIIYFPLLYQCCLESQYPFWPSF